ncbi:unnamed protein product [Gordionus sp. m RMFG-2023]|uniref:interferon-related developmental regulator 1-like n=1 Tax=Gordionus sp. m RMFG-2023 TaxID=3053472 RepID=UPI0030E56AE0
MGKKNRRKQINTNPDILNVSIPMQEDALSETSSNSGIWGMKDYGKVTEDINENEEPSEINLLDEKLDKILEEISNKNINIRLKALQDFKLLLRSQYFPELIDENKVTIMSLLERCVKRDQSIKERILAADNIALFFAQITFFSSDCDFYWKQMEPILTAICKHDSIDIQVREACMISRTFCTFLVDGHDQLRMNQWLDDLEVFFKRPRPSQKKVVAPKTREIDVHVPLHLEPDDTRATRINHFRATALRAYSLLLTQASQQALAARFQKLVPYLIVNLLEDATCPVELRISAAECLAVSFEILPPSSSALTPEQEQYGVWIDRAITIIRSLLAENNKSTSKKDQRVARALFRRVLGTLEMSITDLDHREADANQDNPDFDQDVNQFLLDEALFKTEVVRLGPSQRVGESLVIQTWADSVRYQAMCLLFGHGVIAHLRENEFMRHAFNLGPVIPMAEIGVKLSREDKHAREVEMAHMDKERTRHMRKARRFKDMVRASTLLEE